jgi:hypothetical protein
LSCQKLCHACAVCRQKGSYLRTSLMLEQGFSLAITLTKNGVVSSLSTLTASIGAETYLLESSIQIYTVINAIVRNTRLYPATTTQDATAPFDKQHCRS